MPIRKVSRYHQDFLEIIYKVADKLRLQDIEYTSEYGTEDIDNFMFGMYRVQLGGYQNNQKVYYKIILKWHPDPKMRKPFRDLYIREYTFFQYIVPELLDVQRYFNIIEGLKIKFVNCLYASAEYNKETIVFHNITKEGFRMLDRFQDTDLAHASLVAKNLAKLHALSFVLEKLKPTVFEEIKSRCYTDVQYSDPDRVSKSMECYYNASVNVVFDPVVRDKLRGILPRFLQVLNKCTIPGPYSVICHGDCWNNNVLYRHQVSGKEVDLTIYCETCNDDKSRLQSGRPIDVIFVDYQLLRYASPVTDISYFLYMSTDGNFLSTNTDRILDIYYNTMSAVLRQCNMDIKDVYPKKVFDKQLKEYSVFGLIEALISMKIITADGEEAIKMTGQMCMEEMPENLSPNRSLYVERVNGVVNDFFERGYSLNAVLNGT